MTEEEWLTSGTEALLRRFRSGARERRLRLFACACCRRAPWLTPADGFDEHLRLVERYADGGADEGDRKRAHEAIKATADSYYRKDSARWGLWSELYWASMNPLCLNPSAYGQSVATAFGSAARGEVVYGESEHARSTREAFFAAQRAEREQQASLVRDIFGKSFHKKARVQRRWRTDTAVAIARQMYESRDFFAMPILADALQDAGCDNADILAHCRDPRQVHVRGCWVVDLLLGNE